MITSLLGLFDVFYKSKENVSPVYPDIKNAILDKVRQKLDSFPAYAYNAVLTKPQVMEELDRLKDQFVFVSIDKASNNVAVVCKKFYVEVLHGEINSNTYQQSSESVDDIMERHGVFLQQHGIKLHTDNRCLPYRIFMQLLKCIKIPSNSDLLLQVETVH